MTKSLKIKGKRQRKSNSWRKKYSFPYFVFQYMGNSDTRIGTNCTILIKVAKACSMGFIILDKKCFKNQLFVAIRNKQEYNVTNRNSFNCGVGYAAAESRKGARNMDLLTSNSQWMMEKTMGALWTRQSTILNNIANAETPNYKPQTVSFEDTLRMRLESAAGQQNRAGEAVRDVLDSTRPTVQEAQVSTRMDDNGVHVINESLELVRTGYQLQYLMQSISSDLATLRTAVRGQ